MADNTSAAIGWPLLGTALLHAVVITLLIKEWPIEAQAATVVVQPKTIQARLVTAESLKPKLKKKVVKKKKVIKKKVVVKKKTVKKIVAPKPLPTPKQIEPKIEEKPPVEPTLDSALEELEFSQAMEEEEMMLEAVDDLDVAQSYTAVVRQAVQDSWSRPPSARNNMQVDLAIQLIPTGEVVSVSVVKSSGELVFDRSAVNAVKKAERFPELQKLQSRVFEKHFRRFILRFRPEDLRL